MNSYIVLTPVKYRGEVQQAGTVIELKERNAAQLIRAGAIAKVNGTTQPLDADATTQTPAPNPDAIITAIRDVIPNLQPGDFTKNGDKSPKVKAVEAALSGRYTADDITAELVADAWAHFQADKASKGQEPQHG